MKENYCKPGQAIPKVECLNMKRAVSTLESTVITIGILVLDEVITDYPDVVDNEIVTLLKAARESIDDLLKLSLAWEKFCKQINGLDLREKIQMTIEKRKGNKTLQFLMGFVCLVKRLFTFIEAVRSRDWDLYLSFFEAIIKDFSSLD